MSILLRDFLFSFLQGIHFLCQLLLNIHELGKTKTVNKVIEDHFGLSAARKMFFEGRIVEIHQSSEDELCAILGLR